MIAVAIILAVAAYLIPTIIALARDDPRGVAIMVANLFLGWTVVGWLILIVVAARPITRPVGPPPVTVSHQYGRRRG